MTLGVRSTVSTMPWLAAWQHLLRGFGIIRQQPDLYLKLVLLYSLPPVAGAWVALSGPPQSQVLATALPVITMVVAPVVLMHAVEAGRDGRWRQHVLATSWQFGWVAVQSMRPVLIPALHTVYEDLRDRGAV